MFIDKYKTAIDGYEDFWERRNTKRPILNITYRKPGTVPYREPESDEERWLGAEYIYKAFKHNVASTGYIAEGVPRCFTNFGPGCLAACIGCDYVLRPDTVWFDRNPLIEDWDNVPDITFNEHSEMWQYIVKEQSLFASDPDAGFTVTDLGGIMDIAASLRGTENLLYDLYDYPEEVKALTSRIVTEWNKAYDIELDLLRKAGLPYNTWMNIPSLKTWYPIQCDFCYMISPDHFAEFVLPDVISQVNYMDRSIFHLDGPGEIPHIDMLLDIPGLTGIQWVPGDGNESVLSEKWFDLYRKIQDKKKNLVLMSGPIEYDMAAAERLIKSIDITGVYMSFSCSSKEKAEEVIEKITRWSE